MLVAGKDGGLAAKEGGRRNQLFWGQNNLAGAGLSWQGIDWGEKKKKRTNGSLN